LPGNKTASKVVDVYLSGLIDTISSDMTKDSAEKPRKEQTLLGSLVVRGTSHKARSPKIASIADTLANIGTAYQGPIDGDSPWWKGKRNPHIYLSPFGVLQ
jgi:hypothetical protein